MLEPLNQPVVARYKGKRYTLTPAQARVGVDIDGSITWRSSARARATSSSAPRATCAAGDRRGHRARHRLQPQAIRRLVKRISSKIDRPARDAKLDLEAGATSTRRRRPPGWRCAPRSCATSCGASLLSVEGARQVKVQTKVVQPKVTTRSSPRSTRRSWSSRAARSGSRSTSTSSSRSPTGSRSARSASRRPPGSTTCRTRPSTRPGRCPTPTGWRPGPRQGRPRRDAGEPAQGPLAGDLRRRRHPRHRRGRVDRHGRLARLHPHADPGRDRALRPGAGQRAGVHRVAVRGARETGLGTAAPPAIPSASGRRGGRSGECTGHRCTCHGPASASPRTRAWSRRACPGSGTTAAPGVRPLEAPARLVELAQGGDLTRVGVDEERGHRAPRLATEPGGRPARFDRELQRRGAAERTRRAYGVDLGPARALVHAAASSPTPSTTRPAALRRPARRTWRRPAHRGPQARGHPLVLQVDGRARRDASQPRGLPPPKQPQRLPHTLKPEDVAALLNRIRRPRRWRCATARCSSWPTPAGCARRSSWTWTSSRSTSMPKGQGGGQRGPRRASFPPASRRCARSRAISSAASRTGQPDEERALLLSKSGRRLSTSDVRRRLKVWARHASTQTGVHPHACGTPSRPTCSRAGRICAHSRSSWATRASRRPRSTLG